MTPLLTLSDEFWKAASLDAIWRMGGFILATRDEEGIIVSVNDAAARMFGYDGVLNSMKGMCVDDLVDPAKRAEHRQHRMRFNANPNMRMMSAREGLIGCRRDGSLFTVHIGLYPFDSNIPPEKTEALVLLVIV